MLKDTVAAFSSDKAPRMAAALAYYTIFSIAPLLVITIAIVALVLGQKGATEQISAQLRDLVGAGGAVAIQTMVESANRPRQGIIAVIIGLITLLFGASGVFGELQDSLNTIWKVPASAASGIWLMIKNRFLSFSMILTFGFLLLVSLVISAAISAASGFIKIPGFDLIAHLLNLLLSIVIITVLFAMIFKILPDAAIAWRDVWIGAFATAVLFSIGKFGIGLYLGKGAIMSSYGAMGSLVVVLLWIYYSSMILLFGAEFTHVYSKTHGTRSGTAGAA